MNKYYKYLDHSDINSSYESENSVKPSFTGVKSGTIFNINRPSFKSNTHPPINKPIHRGLLRNYRTGTGNYDLFRNSFRAADIMGRYTVDFDKLELQSLATDGIKVQLGDKTLRDLFEIQVDDPDDRLWIAEYNRRVSSGMSAEQAKNSLPLGRKQRQITKRINIALASQTTNLNLSEKIDLMYAQLSQDAIENKQEIIQITSNAIEILATKLDELMNLSEDKKNELQQVIERLHINPNPLVSLGQIQFTLNEYQAQKGKILLYLLSSIPQGSNLDFNRPIIGINNTPIAINTIDNQLRENFILDVEARRIIRLPPAYPMPGLENNN